MTKLMIVVLLMSLAGAARADGEACVWDPLDVTSQCADGEMCAPDGRCAPACGDNFSCPQDLICWAHGESEQPDHDCVPACVLSELGCE